MYWKFMKSIFMSITNKKSLSDILFDSICFNDFKTEKQALFWTTIHYGKIGAKIWGSNSRISYEFRWAFDDFLVTKSYRAHNWPLHFTALHHWLEWVKTLQKNTCDVILCLDMIYDWIKAISSFVKLRTLERLLHFILEKLS